MSRRAFARGKKALGICDRCGWSWKLSQLKTEIDDGTIVNNRVCPDCWDPDHPQNKAGEIDYSDPTGLRNPRPDIVTGGDPNGVGFEFTTTVEGWAAINSDTLVWNTGGTISHDSTVSDPYIVRGDSNSLPELTIDGDTYDQIFIRIKSISSSSLWSGEFRWFEPSGAFDNDSLVEFNNPFVPIPMGDPWREVHLDMSDVALWTGTIGGLRLDFFTGTADLDIDYIRIEKRFDS